MLHEVTQKEAALREIQNYTLCYHQWKLAVIKLETKSQMDPHMHNECPLPIQLSKMTRSNILNEKYLMIIIRLAKKPQKIHVKMKGQSIETN